MWDNHVHLTGLRDWWHELETAFDRGVTHVVAVATNFEDGERLLAYRAEHARRQAANVPKLLICLGLHPWDAVHAQSGTETARVLQQIRDNAHLLAGVGEIGLDFMPKTLCSADDGAEGDVIKVRQRRAFQAQVALARELGLPINVHSCSAGHHVLELLATEFSEVRALLHAFDGKAKYAELAAARGQLLTAPACTARSPSFQKLVRRVPLSALVLETDSPALAPDKGGYNTPSNISFAVAELARLHGVNEDTVRAVTSANAARLWKSGV